MFSYKTLASDALSSGVIVIADNKLTDLFHICFKLFITYFLMCIILKYIDLQIENNSFILKSDNLINVPIEYKYLKLIFFPVNLRYNVYHCV